MMDWDRPHDIQGLATVLLKHRNYVSDMKACGFQMPGGLATYRQAINWLANHPEFTRRHAHAVRFARRRVRV